MLLHDLLALIRSIHFMLGQRLEASTLLPHRHIDYTRRDDIGPCRKHNDVRSHIRLLREIRGEGLETPCNIRHGLPIIHRRNIRRV